MVWRLATALSPSPVAKALLFSFNSWKKQAVEEDKRMGIREWRSADEVIVSERAREWDEISIENYKIHYES
jgi:hypothetical protein